MTEHFLETVPQGDAITDYDRDHMKLYLRLFDSSVDGADWREAAEILFGLDPSIDPERALRIYDTHLARARWMVSTGYLRLLDRRRAPP